MCCHNGKSCFIDSPATCKESPRKPRLHPHISLLNTRYALIKLRQALPLCFFAAIFPSRRKFCSASFHLNPARCTAPKHNGNLRGSHDQSVSGGKKSIGDRRRRAELHLDRGCIDGVSG